MTSKIGRIIPLVISGLVLIGFLLNFKVFSFLFDNHYRFGAGTISVSEGIDVFRAPAIANFYLHFSLYFIFTIGILLFAFHKRASKGIYLTFSIAMLVAFLIRPVVTLINVYFEEGTWLDFLFLPTVKGQWIGLNDNYFGPFFSFKSYVTGLLLLLLLIANAIFGFIRKGNPVRADQKQTRVMPPQYAQPIQVPVQQQGISVSMTQELERLQQMYQSGALTEAEFTAAKKRVLGN